MESRYVAYFYLNGGTHHELPDSLYYSSQLITLLAKASVFIEAHSGAHCEIWDEKHTQCFSNEASISY